MESGSQKILSKLTLLSLPVALWMVWQLLLPLQQYTFRVWESLIYEKGAPYGIFYPHQHVTMIEAGDLGPYTSHAIAKPVEWFTNSDGYRDVSLCGSPVGIVIGDSMAIGTSLTQNDILSEKLSKKTGQCVQSFAGGKFSVATQRAFDLGLHPQWVYLVIAEWAVPFLAQLENFKFDQVHSGEAQPISMPTLRKTWSQFQKKSYWNYRNQHGTFNALSRSFTSPENSVTDFVPNLSAPEERKRFLFSGKQQSEELTAPQIQQIIGHLNHFAEELQKLNAHLIVSFIPNKESVYASKAGISEPHFGQRFVENLKNEKFQYIDAIALFKRHSSESLYQKDDSHWNAKGVDLLVSQFK